jgi:hypothetical protein
MGHRREVVSSQKLSSTSAVISAPEAASLLGAMRGVNGIPHRTQGGRHAHSTRPVLCAIVSEAAPGAASYSSTPAGAQGPRGAASTPTDSRTTPQTGPHRLRPARTGLHPPDLPPIRPARPRRHPDPRRAHSRQPVADPRRAGTRAPRELPLPLLPQPPVPLGTGPPVHTRGPHPAHTRRPHHAGRRRHRHRAPRPPRLRQGLPPRPGPLHPLVHRVPLGGTSGSSWPCSSASPSPPGPGRCPCW